MTAGSGQVSETLLTCIYELTFGLDFRQKRNKLGSQGRLVEGLDHRSETFQSLDLDREDSGFCEEDLRVSKNLF